MSKSRGNVINPEEMIKKFGADSLRVYLAFIGPYDGTFPWSTAGIKGARKFLERFWRFAVTEAQKEADESEETVKILVNRLIKEVGREIDDFKFNRAIAKLMKFLNEVRGKKIAKKDLGKVLLCLAPFAPFLTEAIWRKYFKESSIHREAWPRYDPNLAKEKKITLIVEINGKVRDRIEIVSGLSEKKAVEIASASAKIKKWLDNKKIKKTIFVKDKLVNFVV